MLSDHPAAGNRWDLLPLEPAVVPTVSVIIPYYRQPRQLELTLAAIGRQTLRPQEIIVSDDGSPEPPLSPVGPIPVRVITQDDRGFRAAAARNHGARYAAGEILAFLDADTVPEPDFLRTLVQRIVASPDVLAVGRRQHADLADMEPGGRPDDHPRLADPQWLLDGYAETGNLLNADGRSFRFVISAVLACRRSLFEELGGFDERFDSYGGEDWEFAYRAWNNGALLVHEPDAVAWHDGPQWGDRSGSGESLDTQALRLAALIPEPSLRGAPLGWARPDLLCDLRQGLSTSDSARIVHSLLRQTAADLLIRADLEPDPVLTELYGPLFTALPWTTDQYRRARAQISVASPLPPRAVSLAMALVADHDVGTVTILTEGVRAAVLRSTRSLARAARWAGITDRALGTHPTFTACELEVGAAPQPRDYLGGYFAAQGEAPGP